MGKLLYERNTTPAGCISNYSALALFVSHKTRNTIHKRKSPGLPGLCYTTCRIATWFVAMLLRIGISVEHLGEDGVDVLELFCGKLPAVVLVVP